MLHTPPAGQTPPHLHRDPLFGVVLPWVGIGSRGFGLGLVSVALLSKYEEQVRSPQDHKFVLCILGIETMVVNHGVRIPSETVDSLIL